MHRLASRHLALLSGAIALGLLSGGCGENKSTEPDREILIPTASISVDGSSADWAGVSPVATDGQGDDGSEWSGADLKALYIAQNAASDTIYAMLQFWDGVPNTDMASGVSTDGDAQNPDVELGYQIAFNAWHMQPPIAEIFARFDTNEGKWYQWDTGTAAGVDKDSVTVAAAEVIEFRFSASVLGRPDRCIVGGSVVTSAFPYGGPNARDYIPDTPTISTPEIRFR
jgi:hypothetical protein